MASNDWLAALQPGDKVIVRSSGPLSDEEVQEVTRLTATQIVIVRGNVTYRYRRDDGRRLGDSAYHYHCLTPYDPTAHEEIRLRQLRWRVWRACSAVRREQAERLTQAQCEAVLACLKAHGLYTKGG